jgi:hypothetical protein
MKIRITLLNATFVWLACAAFASPAGAICADKDSPLAALIKDGNDDGKRTPLILIHGIHGTSEKDAVDKKGDKWDEFEKVFDKKENGLSQRYSLYFFQYCSDREPVAVIATKLRDLIDVKLAGREHVFLTHSMGGLIATSYMAETVHQLGDWKSKSGGQTTLGLITLATPHHGTPGANDPATMAPFIPDKLEGVYNAIQNAYWRNNEDPAKPNRSDLRWDNYDGKLPADSKDINTTLAERNKLFIEHASKLIAYAGTTPAKLGPLEIAAMLFELRRSDDKPTSQHRLLGLANAGMVNALGKQFGNADGFVPQVSALFCQPEAEKVTTESRPNYVCMSTSKVRRFEPGGMGVEVPAAQLPDANTLSIYRSPGGFDHLDMLTNPEVFRYATKDLIAMAPVRQVKP